MRAEVQPVCRFAPSPTGALHLGHARSALLNAEMARATGGRFLLRIEDIDTTRLREPHVVAIYEDLAWLGLDWERPVLRQSTRMAAYAEAAAQLAALGVLYPCFASRTEIHATAEPGRFDPDGAPLYPGLWRGASPGRVERARAAGLPVAYRLDMTRALARLDGAALTFEALDQAGQPSIQACDPAWWGDVVLVRKETPTSYHLAVVVDDAHQGVTLVVRGRDLLAATDVHRLLQVLLGLPAPRYHHHALIVDATGRKLSKSAGDRSLRELRTQGLTPEQIRRRALTASAL